MSLRNTPARWGFVSQALHWAVVALIVTQFVLASVADDLPLGTRKLAVLANHKSFGITILALALVRLAWRRYSPGPALPAGLSRVERTLAAATHRLLYLLLFLTPLAGWTMSSAKNYSVSWFNLVPLPNLVPANERLYDALHEAHEILALSLAAIAVLHAAAALRHHFLLKDDVLRRMLPFTGVAAALVLASVPASRAEAASWASDPARSTLAFSFVQAGARNEGAFTRFAVAVDAPTPTLAGGKLLVTVDVGSLDTRDRDRDELLRGADLFEVAKHPRATFETSTLTAAGPGRVQADGTLTIRGVAQPARLAMTVRPATEAGQSVLYLDGTTTVRRLAFGVGRGEWASTEWVGDEVAIRWSARLVPRGRYARPSRRRRGPRIRAPTGRGTAAAG